MRSLLRISIVITFFSYLTMLHVSALSYEESHMIVAFELDTAEKEVFELLETQGFTVSRKLSRVQQIYLVKSGIRRFDRESVEALKRSSRVRYVQSDHLIQSRQVTPPNSDFLKQWGLFELAGRNDIKATEAWSLGTGGITQTGEDVVVAIVDGGFELDHPSLEENIWQNSIEIPGNGIDDDGNGYIDDIHGWNAYNKNGEIPVADHGTHVMGIVGARAPKEHGSVGVNWQVKLLPVAGSSGRTSVIVEAYSYVLENKLRWLKTGGQEGANVVATNSSFGVDFGDCLSGDYPVWNDLYNAMGEAGILSAAATINSDVNVDKNGDVPTQCTSDFLVAVTNTTKEGVKFKAAGYGKESIDLAAPGTEIFSTVPQKQYAEMTGTSMATPHVAGAIGFLFSVASYDFLQFYYSQPAQGALLIKDILLETVDLRADLEDFTVSGGQLNLQRAAEKIHNWKESL
ncbi:MAG: S8 family serine peptidase [Bdellovibrionales bacterium]|nr:S8 family serine peptidase [Bdellovibrionales bacterium]